MPHSAGDAGAIAWANGVDASVAGKLDKSEASSTYVTPADRTPNTILTGCCPPTSATLTATVAAGLAYVAGKRVSAPTSPHIFTASKDTYIDLGSAGTYTYMEVANGTAFPAVTSGCVRTARVITSATAITTVVSTNTNVALGVRALAAGGMTWGAVAIGFEALENNNPSITADAGLFNTAVGYKALALNVIGNHCTALGWSALLSNTADANTGIGEDALTANVTGTDCTAVGTHAAYQSNASLTTAIGSSSLGNLSTGFANTAVGASSGVATFAGVGNCDTDGQMTFLGSYSSVDKSVNAGPFTNSTALGSSAKVDASNLVQLGENTTTALVRTSGDYETTTVGAGVYLKSPDGTQYHITVANGGVLSAVAGGPAWVTPTLLNSWVPYGSGFGTAQYRMTADGVVSLRGMVKSGNAFQSIFLLPVGYRPVNDELFNVSTDTVPAAFNVKADGNIGFYGGSTGYVTLSGISFSTT